jgi:hypothetical protein
LKRLNWSALLIVQALLISAGTRSSFALLHPSPPSPGKTNGRVIAQVYVRGKHHLDVVAGQLDIWEAHPNEGYVLAAITSHQEQWLKDLGYRVEVDVDRTAALQTSFVLDPRYHYFDQQYPNPNGRYVVDLLRDINAAYPDLTQLIDIGDAWMTLQPGEPHRDLWVLRVTNEDPAYGNIADKPALFISGAMHAREVVASELAIRYLKYLTAGYDGEGGYGLDADVTWLVDHHVAYVLVMHNPDGHVENERNPTDNRRKNMNWDDGCSNPQLWGVDLNRNHSFLWSCCAGSSGDPCAETYRGPGRRSEPETQAFEDYFAKVMKDQNGPNGDGEIAPSSPITTTGIFISLHSYGDLVLWPWSFDGYGSAPNHAELQTIGRKFAVRSGYNPAGSIWYQADGTADDWAYGKFGVPSFTFEVGPGSGVCGGFFPAYECIDGYAHRDFWAENKDAFLYAHKIARMPFVSAYGPDVQILAPADTALLWDGSGQLLVTITDERCCGDTAQAIAGAEYFVDSPGEDGTGIPMEPVGGDWGDQPMDSVATVDTSEFPLGRHYILVHGQSADGSWGPFSGAFAQIDHRIHLPLVVQ